MLAVRESHELARLDTLGSAQRGATCDRGSSDARAEREELFVAEPGKVAREGKVFLRQAQLLFHLSLSLFASCVARLSGGGSTNFIKP